MAESVVEILGLQEAFADISKAVDRMKDSVGVVSTSVAEQAKGTTQEKVPVVTGTLRGSLNTVAVEGGRAVRYDNSQAPYAGWLEFGGSHGREHYVQGRWLMPSMLALEDLYVNKAEQAATRTVENYPWHKQ
jgi:hypothetical protein